MGFQSTEWVQNTGPVWCIAIKPHKEALLSDGLPPSRSKGQAKELEQSQERQERHIFSTGLGVVRGNCHMRQALL
jgi:hypothetical protein